MGLTRTCKICEKEKPFNDFPHGRGGNGYAYTLRTCSVCYRAIERKRAREYKSKNREAIKRRERLDKSIRYENDPEYRERLKERAREYYYKNRKKILAKKRAKREGTT